jgi:hypothetical protein
MDFFFHKRQSFSVGEHLKSKIFITEKRKTHQIFEQLEKKRKWKSNLFDLHSLILFSKFFVTTFFDFYFKSKYILR